jgi:hypothetical protein
MDILKDLTDFYTYLKVRFPDKELGSLTRDEIKKLAQEFWDKQHGEKT